MSYFADLNHDAGYFTKPRYRNDVLLGNWFEERARRDPNFLPLPEYKRKPESVDNMTRLDRAKDLSSGSATVTTDRTRSDRLLEYQKEAERESPDGILSGYYYTSYKRAYEPHHLHLASFPSINSYVESSSATTTDQQQAVRSRSQAKSCPRCEQLAAI